MEPEPPPAACAEIIQSGTSDVIKSRIAAAPALSPFKIPSRNGRPEFRPVDAVPKRLEIIPEIRDQRRREPGEDDSPARRRGEEGQRRREFCGEGEPERAPIDGCERGDEPFEDQRPKRRDADQERLEQIADGLSNPSAMIAALIFPMVSAVAFETPVTLSIH
jgi:hypothetical protein